MKRVPTAILVPVVSPRCLAPAKALNSARTHATVVHQGPRELEAPPQTAGSRGLGVFLVFSFPAAGLGKHWVQVANSRRPP